MRTVSFKDLDQASYRHQLMFSVTEDGHCYVYALCDLLGKTNLMIKFYEVEMNQQFHFSAGAVTTLYECLSNNTEPRIKEIKEKWKESIKVNSKLCAPRGTKSRKQLKKNEKNMSVAEDYFIDNVCYWGKVVRNIDSIREYFEIQENRTDFIKKIKRRLSKRGDAAYMSISQDCSNTEGMGLSIYTKCLRAIKPEKFFTVDLVYEKFFKTKRDNYLYYKVAFEKVFNELKKDGVNNLNAIGDFELVLYHLIQYSKRNAHS